MKKIAFCFAALCACMTLSCNKELSTSENEVTIPEETMQTITISASISDTKTSYTIDPDDDTKMKFSWTKDDEISVLCSDNQFYTFKANTTGDRSTFTGQIPAGESLGDRAYFPADAGHTISSFNIPAFKDLTGHPSADIPMRGKKGDGNDYAFEHLVGAARLIVDNIPNQYTSATISFTTSSGGSGVKLSGSFNLYEGSKGYYKWNPVYADTDGERNYTRKVVVSNNKATVYIPFAVSGTIYSGNTVIVTGHDELGNDDVLYSNASVGSIGPFDKAHLIPLAPLGLSKVGIIDWTDAGINTYAANGEGSNTGDRIIQWKAYKDSYYLYFWYKILKEKIKFGTSSYDDSQSRIYIGLDLDNNSETGSNASFAGLPASGWEATVEVRPWSGTVSGSPEVISGVNANSYIDRPVGTTLGSKVSQYCTFDSTYAYLELGIPLSALGAMESTIKVRHGMQWGYYTSFESVTF